MLGSQHWQSRPRLFLLFSIPLLLQIAPHSCQKSKLRDRKALDKEKVPQFAATSGAVLPVAAKMLVPKWGHLATNRSVPAHYHSLDEIYSQLEVMAAAHRDLIRIDTIGYSTRLRQPILALKLSDSPSLDEDEPAVLFTALHHAREPLGTLLCIRLMRDLLENYPQDKLAREALESLEIWCVPIVNPDGYKYLMDNQLSFPWWRKNLRDNDNDGEFNPIVDGVDLNRNYDFNWSEGGEGNPASWFFRGQSPFSESEISAVRDLALRENVYAGLSFHSYGEILLYPWGNFARPPDLEVILYIANATARSMHKVGYATSYGVLPLNGRVGQSSVWMYGQLRAIDYIVELGDEHFPDGRKTPEIIEEGERGVRNFLHLIMQMGVRGHVLDAETQAPVRASVRVEGFEANYLADRYSDEIYGRFEKVLLPGKYTFTFTALGYQAKTIRDVIVSTQSPSVLEVKLERQDERVHMSNH